MLKHSASWRIAAISVVWLAAANLYAQPLPPKIPAQPASGSGSAQILPVSLKNEHVAAVVNGEKILVGEVKKVIDQRPYPNTLTEEQKREIRKAAIEVLIEDVLMRQYLTKYVPKVSQADFDKEVAELNEALKKQKKSLQEYLTESGQTQEMLSRDIVARLQWKQLLTRFYPEEKAKAYYEENKLFFDKVFVRASHILLKLPGTATAEQKNQAMQQMLVWRQDILAGKARFEDIAAKYSDCPSKGAKDKDGKPTPGDIGQFPYKFVVVPEFAKAAFSMQKGQISGVVATSFGLHLILVTDRTPGEPSNFAALKDTVREVQAQDDDLYQRVLADERKKGSIKVELP